MFVTERVHPCEVNVNRLVSKIHAQARKAVRKPSVGLGMGLAVSALAGAPMPLPQLALAGPWLAACAAGALGARAGAAVGLTSFLLFAHPTPLAMVLGGVIALLAACGVPAAMASFSAAAEEESSQGAASALVVDCEGFASLDDVYGPGTGDHVFRLLRRSLQVETRDTDFVVQTRNQELILVLDGSSPEIARLVIKRVERRFSDWLRDAGYECDLSVGVSSIEEDKDQFDALMKEARRAEGNGYLD